jgi:uncharacterized membrane protein YqgA involved in biofilm formation
MRGLGTVLNVVAIAAGASVGLARIRVANLLPAVLLAPLATGLVATAR